MLHEPDIIATSLRGVDGTASTLVKPPPQASSEVDGQTVPRQTGDTAIRTMAVHARAAAAEGSPHHPPRECRHTSPLTRPSDDCITVEIPLAIEADSPGADDRKHQLYAKLNLDHERSRQPKIAYERVHKSTRMRVRYTCHQCRTSFGHDRVCFSCRHRRCTRCDRHPPRKTRQEKADRTAAKDAETQAAPTEDMIQQDDESAKELYCNCHECQTGIDMGVEECPNCHHTICERCIEEYAVVRQPRHESPHQQREQADSIPSDLRQQAASRPTEEARVRDVEKRQSIARPPT